MRLGAGRLRSVLARGVNPFALLRAAPFYARYTMRFHLPAELLLGAYSGVAFLADLVSRKTLGASDWVLSLQASVPMMAFIFAMVWRELLEGVDRKKILVVTGLLGKGLFVAAAAVTDSVAFLVLFTVIMLVDSAFIPMRNSIFRANYDQNVRGRLFGSVVSLMSIVLIVTNRAAAGWLDHDDQSYRILFPIAGILGLGAHLLYARIRLRGEERNHVERTREPILRRIARPFRTTARILRVDRAFRAYEVGFFVYGLAFLMNLPLVVMLIVDELNLDYGPAATARFIFGQVMMIVLSPFVGRLLDRSHPARLMAGGGLLLALHSGLLFLAQGVEMVAASYLVYGIAMTAVNLAWNLGPVHFAPTERDSADYMAVHVTLVGLRAILAPFLVLVAKGLLGLRAGFAVSATLYVLATVLMIRLAARSRASATG
jgi:predicted MFS family arabinose efflux permease